jgi:hypothetical protein
MNFINKSGLDFKDISTEEWREYVYETKTIRIEFATQINVSPSGGHRLFSEDGVSHYIPSGWLHLKWKSKQGEPNFVF